MTLGEKGSGENDHKNIWAENFVGERKAYEMK